MRARIALVSCAAIALAALLGSAQEARAQQALPDLTIDANRVAASWDVVNRRFKTDDCAVYEGCVEATGKRKLLRFDVATPNLGSADLFIGNPAGNPLFEFSPCHGHYHFSGYAEYNLIDPTNLGVVLRGRKQAFCLLDSSRVVPGAPSSGYHCGYQGISAGWQDVYGKYLDCQWLDVTRVRRGTYILEVVVNPRGVRGEPGGLVESDYTNNVSWTTVVIR